LLLVNDRGDDVPRDRISIEVLHKDNNSLYNDRLVFCVARLTSSMVKGVTRSRVPRITAIRCSYATKNSGCFSIDRP
jgi:hypothetical protein